MIFILPHVGKTADESFYVSLDDVKYEVRMRWNSRDESWWLYIGFEGVTATLITKITSGADVLRPYRARQGVPSGSIYLYDTESNYGRATRDNTGADKRFKLIYINQEENERLNEL